MVSITPILHNFLYFTFYIFFPKQKIKLTKKILFVLELFWTIFIYAKKCWKQNHEKTVHQYSDEPIHQRTLNVQ